MSTSPAPQVIDHRKNLEISYKRTKRFLDRQIKIWELESELADLRDRHKKDLAAQPWLSQVIGDIRKSTPEGKEKTSQKRKAAETTEMEVDKNAPPALSAKARIAKRLKQKEAEGSNAADRAASDESQRNREINKF